MGVIYRLIDPTGLTTRYIGETGKSLYERWAGHPAVNLRNKNTRDPRLPLWIRGLILDGLVPHIEVLETVEDTGDPKIDRARRLAAEASWVAIYRSLGCDPFNKDQRGRKRSAEARARIGTKARARVTGGVTREKLRVSAKRGWATRRPKETT